MENSEINTHASLSLPLSFPPSLLPSLHSPPCLSPFPGRVTHGRQLLSASDLREQANGKKIKKEDAERREGQLNQRARAPSCTWRWDRANGSMPVLRDS